MNHIFHPEARLEYFDAVKYYNSRSRGLGIRFTLEIDAAIAEIAAFPQRWPFFEEDVRRFLTPTFPFGILYIVESDHVQVIAVMHCSRDPEYWKHRMS